MKTKITIKKIIDILKLETKNLSPTLMEQIIDEYDKDPFIILICCLLSLRSKDKTTIHVCRNLLKIAKTPKQLLDIKRSDLEKIIYQIGFYKNKAKVLHEVSDKIINKYNGSVPNDFETLLNLPGVGRKTANLTMSLAFNVPAICVDVHVHRISNRLGILKTKTPEQTEEALKKFLDKKYWTLWNTLLVKWGQNNCTPISPKCNRCAINILCERVGVIKHH